MQINQNALPRGASAPVVSVEHLSRTATQENLTAKKAKFTQRRAKDLLRPCGVSWRPLLPVLILRATAAKATKACQALGEFE